MMQNGRFSKREVTLLHRGGRVGEDGGGVGVDHGDDDGPRRRSGATGSEGERAHLILLP